MSGIEIDKLDETQRMPSAAGEPTLVNRTRGRRAARRLPARGVVVAAGDFERHREDAARRSACASACGRGEPTISTRSFFRAASPAPCCACSTRRPARAGRSSSCAPARCWARAPGSSCCRARRTGCPAPTLGVIDIDLVPQRLGPPVTRKLHRRRCTWRPWAATCRACSSARRASRASGAGSR